MNSCDTWASNCNIWFKHGSLLSGLIKFFRYNCPPASFIPLSLDGSWRRGVMSAPTGFWVLPMLLTALSVELVSAKPSRQLFPATDCAVGAWARLWLLSCLMHWAPTSFLLQPLDSFWWWRQASGSHLYSHVRKQNLDPSGSLPCCLFHWGLQDVGSSESSLQPLPASSLTFG